MPHPVIDAAVRFRLRLINRSAAAEQRMAQAYGRAFQRVQPQIRALEEATLGMGDVFLSRGKAMELASLRNLRTAVEGEISRYAIVADQEIANLTSDAVRAGLSNSRDIAASYFDPAYLRERGLTRLAGSGRQALTASWNQLAPEQVETLIGFLSEDSPLHSNLVDRLGDAVAERMANKLAEAISLGINPNRIGAEIARELGVGLTWSQTTARTAQMWAYREATRANYMANSDVISGWTWYSALDTRVCMSCLSKHGQRFPVNAVLADHHNGRCVAIPALRFGERFGIEIDEIEPGETWFNKQSEATQKTIMGPGMFDAWKAGEFAFRELSVRVENPIYGEMFQEATLKGLLGSKAKQYYRRNEVERVAE